MHGLSVLHSHDNAIDRFEGIITRVMVNCWGVTPGSARYLPSRDIVTKTTHPVTEYVNRSFQGPF